MTDGTEKVLLIDGNGLAYRAFYAMPDMKTSRGEPVNAVLGFTNMLLRILDDEMPDYVAVAFDKAPPTVRLEQFSQYKEQRQKMPESLGFQMPLMEEVVRSLDIPVLWHEGWEADDCLATVAKMAVRRGSRVLIVSGDMDLLQLVSPQVHILTTRKGISDIVVYDEKAVKERYGLTPLQIPDYKAIAGDPSDNIPGIAGIGETGAKKLLGEFGSLEDVYANVDRIPGRLREKVAADGGKALRFKDLTRLAEDLPLEISWDAMRRTAPSLDAVKPLFTRLEFRSLLKRLFPGGDDAAEAPERRCQVVLGESDLDGLVCAARREGAIAFFSPDDASGVSALAAACGGEDYLVPFSSPREGFLFDDGDGSLGLSRVAEAVRELLCDSAVTTYVHDVKSFLKRFAISMETLCETTVDTALAAYLLDAGERIAVQDVAGRFLHRDLPAFPKEKAGSADGRWEKVAAQYARAILDAGPVLMQKLDVTGMTDLYRTVEMPLVPVLKSMEERGLALDRKQLTGLSGEMARILDSLQKEIWALTGEQFNINSPKQLGEVLFERLGLPGAQKTKTGYATGSEVLEPLLAAHPVIEKIMYYREVAKLKATYGDALPRALSAQTGRLHTTLNQMVTSTGRLSSSEPNLQNIPVRSPLGRLIRSAFIASPGFELLSLDYSQIELRVLAHFSGDEAMVRAFEEDRDIHTVTASLIFGVPAEGVSKDMRRKAKEINFGLLYGMSAHGLALRLAISRAEAKEYMDSYFNRFPSVSTFLGGVVEEARERGYVATFLGRRRYLPDLNSRNFTLRRAAERMALNAPIQGSAADIIKMAMVKVHELFRGRRGDVRMLLQVHDDLLFEVRAACLEEVHDQVRRVMEGICELRVPLRVTSSHGVNWADMVPMEERVAS